MSGFCTELWQFYGAIGLQVLELAKYGLVRSVLSKCVDPDETGKIFSVLSILAATLPALHRFSSTLPSPFLSASIPPSVSLAVDANFSDPYNYNTVYRKVQRRTVFAYCREEYSRKETPQRIPFRVFLQQQ